MTSQGIPAGMAEERPAAVRQQPGSEVPSSLSFEEALSRVEAIVAAMEDGGLSLDEAVACYEEAAGLIARCRQLLAEAELRISSIPLRQD
jgi:exodeoxyribonuclease VII small subunit